jgi:glycosyltransferase involved in cell wall biosynthesis
MRVAVIFDNIGPYHLARLLAASRVLDVLAVEVRAKSRAYAWLPPQLPQGLAHVDLLSPDTDTKPTWREMITAIDAKVRPFSPDVVALTGWSFLDALAGLAWAADIGIPAVIMTESNRDDIGRAGAVERIKSQVVRTFAAGLAGGRSARDYLIKLGMPEAAVFLGYDVVDNAFFTRRAAAVRASGTMPLIEPRRRLDGRWRGRYFLASARFIPVKNLPGLFDAYAAYRDRTDGTHESWPLVLLGDGCMRGELEDKLRALGLEGCVHLPGFKQYDELPEYYGTAGAFVHASSMEPWGLVVNEAMASGLPVAVSRRCGCAEMLVTEGENGITFDPSDQGAITEALWRLATQLDLAALGAASEARIADWGPDRFAEGLRRACEYAVRAERRPLGTGLRVIVRTAAEIQSRRL